MYLITSVILVWALVSFIFLICSSSLLFSLIIMEIMTFLLLFSFSISMSLEVFSDYFLLTFFSLFVMEGVIGLTGFIALVSFTGSDYLSVSSITSLN